MLRAEVHTNPAGEASTTVAASGKLIEIVAEVGSVIAGVHDQLVRNNLRATKLFRLELINLLTDPDTPVWKGSPNARGIMITMPKTEEEE